MPLIDYRNEPLVADDEQALLKVLHQPWVVLPRDPRDGTDRDTCGEWHGRGERLSIAVKFQSGYHNIAWFPWGFPRLIVEGVVKARNRLAAGGPD